MEKSRISLSQRIAILFAGFVIVTLLGAVALANVIPFGFRVFAFCWLTYFVAAFIRPTVIPSRLQRGVIVVALVAAIAQCTWQFPIYDIRYADDYGFLMAWGLLVIWFSCAPGVNWLQRQLAVLLFIGGWAAGFFYQVSGGAIGMFGTIGIGIHLLLAWPEITHPKDKTEAGKLSTGASAGRMERNVTNAILWTVMIMALILIYLSGRPPIWIRRLL